MFYETAQTVGPGWHRSYKPSHYEDMTWTPSNRQFRSPGSSPETYRRIIRNEEDFPSRRNDDEFFNSRRSPTFPRRHFKESWNESPSSNHRFSDRPKMFKRVFKPDRWEDEFDKSVPYLRRIEREFDRNFDSGSPSRKFEDLEKKFSSLDLKNQREDNFEKSDGKVHHIPIMVERRMSDMKSGFEKKDEDSPPREKYDKYDDFSEEWMGPQVERLKKNFEQPENAFSSRYKNYQVPRNDTNSKPRPYVNLSSDSWDPHAIHTLPTRKAHKATQSFDDSRHPVPPKYVSRSYSETHEDSQRPQQPHSAAFRSHSDGHCPQQTYVTKINVSLPSQKEKDELSSSYNQSNNDLSKHRIDTSEQDQSESADLTEEMNSKSIGRNKFSNPSMQQIAAVLQNVEDLVTRIDGYSGTGRDKQYRFLDEMLTRCMLRLDDVDTEGREDIRNARKSAVQIVQNCIDKLETKADESERRFEQTTAAPLETDISLSSDQPEKKAIPLELKTNNNESQPNNAIPLPAGPIENKCVRETNIAIPMGDKPNENEHISHKNKAIPLGFTQVANNNENINDATNPKLESSTGEQTKL